jgi:c-di-GMP-related signal transduction protein
MPTLKNAPTTGQVFVARQPILDRNKRVIGYELRFKPSPGAAPEAAGAIDSSARVISDAVVTVGLDQLTDGRRAFVNVSRQLLLDGIPSVLPSEQVVLELASDIEADGEVLEACESLRAKGYSIAVDDFSLNEWTADLVPFADYLKVDFAVHPDAEARQAMTSSRGGHSPALIAKGIETMDAFESAVTEGYAFFQGFFFGRPLITQARDVPGHQVAHLRLLHALNNPNLSVHQLEDLIKHDASLCYRILRTVNSAAYALRTPITSIRQALVYLGRDTVRRWVSLWALAGLSERAHAEVVVMSTIRARFCELVAAGRGDEDSGAEGFLLGMCSLLDVILDRPMDAVLAQLPLSPETQAALRGEDNEGRKLLDCVIAYERGIWDRAVELARVVGVQSLVLPKAHADSLRWTRELQRGFTAKD